jgi:tetratricopeptide (TPR) repeat protein
MAALGAALLLAWPAISENAVPAGVGDDAELAPGSPGAEERMGQAYVFMTRADQSRQEGNPEKAKENYEEALGLLEALETDYPGWYTQVVRHRILACESAIELIRNGKPPPPSVSESTAEKAADPLDVVSFPLSADSSETAMRALRAGIEERDLSVSDLRAEIFDLKEQNRKLASKLAKFTGEKAPAVAGSPGVTYPDVLKEEVRKRIETGAYTNAIALLEEMKTLLPEDTDVPRLLGVAFCRQGYFVEALRVIEPLVKRGRAPADVLLTLGVAYLGTGNLGRARNAFEKALDRDPLLSEAHFNLAQILIRLKPPEADLARRHYLIATQQGATRDSALETAIGQALMYEQARKLKR